jgi:hypothetical protein
VCSYVSMGILGLMIVSMIALLVYQRKSKDLPRSPDTVGNIASYLCGGSLVEEFEGCERANGKEMSRMIGQDQK